MASPDLSTLPCSTLNRFLYADIPGADGTAGLTLLSLFGQRGEDPWDAAAGLARLPAGLATARLAAMIAEIPAHPCSLADAAVMAERLVALLPAPAAPTRPAARRPARSFPFLAWPSEGWPFGVLATCAAALAALVSAVWVCQTLSLVLR